MRRIYIKRNVGGVLVLTFSLILIFYVLDRPPSLYPSNFISSIMIIPSSSAEKRRNISSNFPRCDISVALILCQADGFIKLKNQSLKSDHAHSHIAKDFTRQLNQTLTLLKSIALQTEDERCVTVYIISEKDNFDIVKGKVNGWSQRWKGKLNLTHVFVEYPKGLEDMVSWFRPCATLRLFLPDILPSSIETLLYLDTDIIFLDSPQQLMTTIGWDTFRNKTAAMAPCLFHYGSKSNLIPYYGESGLNAGVMLMNLNRMREQSWTSKVKTVTEMYKQSIKLADQDILNIYFHFFPEEISLIPCHWNFRPFQCRKGSFCEDPGLGQGISALHGNALSFTENGPEPLFRTVFTAFHALSLKSDDIDFTKFLERLEIRLLRSEESVKNSECAKYGSFSALVLARLQKFYDL